MTTRLSLYILSQLASTASFKSVAQQAKDIFPSATYVVDKYHYARQVLWAFEAVRKEVQKDFFDERRKYFKRSRTLPRKN